MNFLNLQDGWISLLITALLAAVFRKNGIYAVLPTVLCLIIFAKKYYKQILLLFFIIIFIYNIMIEGVFLKLANIGKGSIVEALSVPFQQIARVVYCKENELTDEEKDTINMFWHDVNIRKKYVPVLSDNIKSSIDEDILKEKKVEFIKLWLSLFKKYPMIYLESFLCNSFGYWYPEVAYWVVVDDICIPFMPKGAELQLKQTPIINSNIIKNMPSFIEDKNTPVISMIFSIGLAMWVVFIMIAYNIYKKQYNNLLIYLPIIFLWITILASPVFCEYRYMYSLFTTMPILISIGLKEKN